MTPKEKAERLVLKYLRIDKLFGDCNRLEMFARTKTEGWDVVAALLHKSNKNGHKKL